MSKAVLFDLDGTLLDRDKSVTDFISSQYRRLYHYLNHISEETFTTRFIELDNRGYVWKDKVYQQMVEQLNINLRWEFLLDDYITMFKHSCVAFPNLIPMLDELQVKAISLGIITNGKGQFQLDNIKALGIENYFKTILISEWEGVRKPDPLLFEKALRKLHIQPHECIFVGDHPKNDIQAAHNVGMKTIWKKNKHWQYTEAEYRINDLGEIPAIIT